MKTWNADGANPADHRIRRHASVIREDSPLGAIRIQRFSGLHGSGEE
jgi:hypothetical protein